MISNLSTRQTRLVYLFAIFMGSLLISSCATILNGSTDTVTIVSEEKDSKNFINGEYHGRDDTIVKLRRGKQYEIYSTKEGCETTTVKSGDNVVVIIKNDSLVQLKIKEIGEDRIIGFDKQVAIQDISSLQQKKTDRRKSGVLAVTLAYTVFAVIFALLLI